MSLRDRIAAAACGATSAGKLFPWDTLSETQRDSWRKMADAVIRELGPLVRYWDKDFKELHYCRECGGWGPKDD